MNCAQKKEAWTKQSAVGFSRYESTFKRILLFKKEISRRRYDGGSALGRGGGGWELPAAYKSKTISDNEIKFVGVVENHRLINLVLFNLLMMS